MQALGQRFNYLFRSTKGLDPGRHRADLARHGDLGDALRPDGRAGASATSSCGLFGLRLVEAEREGRIIMLYHTIAMAVVAIEMYIITALVPMKKQEQATINATHHLWLHHGHDLWADALPTLGTTGSSTACSSLGSRSSFSPACCWRRRCGRGARSIHVKDNEYAHAPGGLDLERVAFFSMAVATLGSVLFGAVPGSYFGNGFEVLPGRRRGAPAAQRRRCNWPSSATCTSCSRSSPSPLALIVGRWLDFKGALHKSAMPLMIVGTLIISMGAWFVVPFEAIAHIIIYVGSTLGACWPRCCW